MKRAIRQLIIGKGVYIKSSAEFKQVMLSGHYALLSLLVIVIYLLIEVFQGAKDNTYFFVSTFCLIASTILLHRKRLHCYANYVLFATLNIGLYLMASSESIATGAVIFFIPVVLGAAAVFNYAQRYAAFAFTLLSFVFCSLILYGYSFLPYRDYSQSEIKVIQILNFGVAFPISFIAVYLLISLNHYRSRKLKEANVQLKMLNNELDRFVYSTAHDLRAPLLSVLGLLRLAENGSQQEVERYHKLMHDRIHNLDYIINDITTYSRNKQTEIMKEPVAVKKLVFEVWEMLRYSKEAKGIEFINDVPEDLEVVNDITRLRTVLNNLISNAIRYHDHRKENKFIRVSHHVTETSFMLHVEDNGQGIASEIQSKIFEMFYRGNHSSQGTGLGLYIVKEMLARLSASIVVSSKPMQGSTFSIMLPGTV